MRQGKGIKERVMEAKKNREGIFHRGHTEEKEGETSRLQFLTAATGGRSASLQLDAHYQLLFG